MQSKKKIFRRVALFAKKSKLPAFLAAGLGILFMTVGIWRGEMAVVFAKAAKICLECIGIG